jgi:hypothetical protein
LGGCGGSVSSERSGFAPPAFARASLAGMTFGWPFGQFLIWLEALTNQGRIGCSHSCDLGNSWWNEWLSVAGSWLEICENRRSLWTRSGRRLAVRHQRSSAFISGSPRRWSVGRVDSRLRGNDVSVRDTHPTHPRPEGELLPPDRRGTCTGPWAIRISARDVDIYGTYGMRQASIERCSLPSMVRAAGDAHSQRIAPILRIE